MCNPNSHEIAIASQRAYLRLRCLRHIKQYASCPSGVERHLAESTLTDCLGFDARGRGGTRALPRVHAVVCLTWELGSFKATRKKSSPIWTKGAKPVTVGPSRIDPKAKVAASRFLQSSGALFLLMLSCMKSRRLQQLHDSAANTVLQHLKIQHMSYAWI